MSQPIQSFFHKLKNWEDLPTSWDTEMVDSMVEELMCQDLPEGCTEQHLVTQFAIGTDQVACRQDLPFNMEDLDDTPALDTVTQPLATGVRSLCNPRDTPMGTFVLDKSETAHMLSSLK